MLQYDNGLIKNCISYTILPISGPGDVFISKFCEIYRHKANSKKPQLSSSTEHTCPGPVCACKPVVWSFRSDVVPSPLHDIAIVSQILGYLFVRAR